MSLQRCYLARGLHLGDVMHPGSKMAVNSGLHYAASRVKMGMV